MKILVAVDGSSCSVRAVQGMYSHAGWFREPPAITLMTVHPPLPTKRAAAWAGREAVEKYYREECETALAPARKMLDELGLSYDTVMKVGEVADEITKYAAKQGCDLIVMGTHGRTGIKNLVLGSVATKVLAASKVPVLLFK